MHQGPGARPRRAPKDVPARSWAVPSLAGFPLPAAGHCPPRCAGRARRCRGLAAARADPPTTRPGRAMPRSPLRPSDSPAARKEKRHNPAVHPGRNNGEPGRMRRCSRLSGDKRAKSAPWCGVLVVNKRATRNRRRLPAEAAAYIAARPPSKRPPRPWPWSNAAGRCERLVHGLTPRHRQRRIQRWPFHTSATLHADAVTGLRTVPPAAPIPTQSSPEACSICRRPPGSRPAPR